MIAKLKANVKEDKNEKQKALPVKKCNSAIDQRVSAIIKESLGNIDKK